MTCAGKEPRIGHCWISESEREALVFLRNRLQHGKPRTLRAETAKQPILIHTDGALEYETEGQGIGAIGGVFIHFDGVVRFSDVRFRTMLCKVGKKMEGRM